MILEKRFYKYISLGNESKCILWTAHVDCWGYAVIWDNAKKGNVHASRVSYDLFNGPIPGDLVILHTCDNPSCVNPEHLILGTQDRNMKDMVAKGRSMTGEKNHKSKLTISDVGKIRALYTNGTTPTDLSKLFKVTRTNIHDIVSGRTWKQ